MTPTLPIPTDNIYKFACLFGLALIVASIFSFVSIYSATLDRSIKYAEAIIALESKAERTKSEEELLALNKKVLDVAQENKVTANQAMGLVMGVGLVLSVVGGSLWLNKIQFRDDRLALLQIEKLELEVANLRGGLVPQKGGATVETASPAVDRQYDVQ